MSWEGVSEVEIKFNDVEPAVTLRLGGSGIEKVIEFYGRMNTEGMGGKPPYAVVCFAKDSVMEDVAGGAD